MGLKGPYVSYRRVRAKLLSHVAVAADKLSLGLLMEPEEVARTVAPHQPDAVSGRWWLCGNMHRRMFSAAQQQPLRHLGKCIVTAEGTRYLVIAQQTGTWQHRLLLQVAGQQVTDFLAASVLAGFDLSLGVMQQMTQNWLETAPDKASRPVGLLDRRPSGPN